MKLNLKNIINEQTGSRFIESGHGYNYDLDRLNLRNLKGGKYKGHIIDNVSQNNSIHKGDLCQLLYIQTEGGKDFELYNFDVLDFLVNFKILKKYGPFRYIIT